MASCGNMFCIDCGRCRGEEKPLAAHNACLLCGHLNNSTSSRCEACGAQLPIRPGVTFTPQLSNQDVRETSSMT